MILRSVYYFCRRNNWITWFVPSARAWTHKGTLSLLFSLSGYQVIEMTRRAGGFFAQPEHCQKLLLDVPFLLLSHTASHHKRSFTQESPSQESVRSLPLLGQVTVRRGIPSYLFSLGHRLRCSSVHESRSTRAVWSQQRS